MPWAAGFYHIRDRYCTVKASLSPRFRREVLKHELIHACCDRLSREFHSSWLVSEGLAEYLRFCRPGHQPHRLLGPHPAVTRYGTESIRSSASFAPSITSSDSVTGSAASKSRTVS